LPAGRDPVGGHAESVEQPPDRLGRLSGLARRREAAQVQVELAAGKLAGRASRPVDRECRFAYPGGAGDRDDQR
jgi:hypothetical protein